MSGVFDFLHIKGRTAGSSNELSFDVLEQKSVEADGKAQRNAKLPKAPKPSQGSYQGVAQSLTLSGQAEVEKRKKARRSYRIRLKVIVVLVVMAVVSAGVYAGVKFHNDQVNFQERINALVNRLSDVDETLVEIDAMMNDPFNAEQAEQRAQALKAMTSKVSELNNVSKDARELMKLPISEDDEVVVGQIDKAAQARNGMLAVAKDAFELSSDAADLVAQANAVWGAVLNADQLAREATSLANRATTQDVTTQAIEATRQAQEAFSVSLAEMQELGSTHKIDFSAQEAYLAKKVESLNYAIATGEALLAGDRDAAKAANDAYNVADGEAVKLAGSIPPSIGDIVQHQFDVTMGNYQERYGEARDSAVKTDAIIREYLNR